MGIRLSQPPHLRKPALVFGVAVVLYSLLVVAAFHLTSLWLPEAAEWRSYVAAIPGVVLSLSFAPLYFYMKHNDELVRQISVSSLAAAAVTGFAAHLLSMTRAKIGGYPEFEGAVIVLIMAVTFIVAALSLSWKHR